MKALKYLPFAILALQLTSCFNGSYEVEKFSTENLKWFNCFQKTDTIIFASTLKELDTIIFKKMIANSDSIRSYKQGYYNTNYLSVPYEFTKGSYHQFSKSSDNKTRYKQNILNLSKTSSGIVSFELIFIGVIFNKKSMKTISEIQDGTFLFRADNGTYSKVNVETGLDSFIFEIGRGVTEYIDERNIRWIRK